jgi:hypothetical protein
MKKFKDTLEVQAWLSGPFFRAICKANAKEFENAKQVDDHVVLAKWALGDQEVAIVFQPRHEWPRMFKFLPLYRDAPQGGSDPRPHRRQPS